MSKTPQAISNFAVQSPLDVATVECALNELLAAVRDDQVPATAVDQMHDYYDRYITWQNHFLHHLHKNLSQKWLKIILVIMKVFLHYLFT